MLAFPCAPCKIACWKIWGEPVRKFGICLATILILASGSCLMSNAFAADEPVKVRHAKRVTRAHPPQIPCDACGAPIVCPHGMCYSLYGAYGPYGGAAYWSRYSAEGWHNWGYR